MFFVQRAARAIQCWAFFSRFEYIFHKQYSLAAAASFLGSTASFGAKANLFVFATYTTLQTSVLFTASRNSKNSSVFIVG